MSLDVRDAPGASRWEARTADGSLAGTAEYVLEASTITFTHTVVTLEGQGVGSALVRAALDDTRARGLRVRPQCPFVRGWIDRHPDYADLVDG